MSLSGIIIDQLKKHSVLPVYIGEREASVEQSILISPVKLDELVSKYETLYSFSHTIWRNLPPVPDCENVFVLVWMLAADKYEVNHLTVKWDGSNSNTFVYLWSTVDRLSTVIDDMTAFWLLGSRNAVQYAESTNMPGAADAYLYRSEVVTPPHIAVFSSTIARCRFTTTCTEYESLYDFRMSMMVKRTTKPVSVDDMAMNNAIISKGLMSSK